MQRPSIGSALLTAGLIAALTGPPPATPGSPAPAAVADTTDVTAPWMKQVTMEPIRVVVPRETQYEAVRMEPIRVVAPREPQYQAVTMEPIRVVIPRETQYEAVTMEPIRVVIPRAESAAPEDREASPRR